MMPGFAYITISGLMFLASMKTYKSKLLYILNEEADFQKVLYFTDTYLLFAKMQGKSLKSQAKIDFFKIEYGIFRLKNSWKASEFHILW